MLNSPVKLWRQQKEIRFKIGKIGKIISWTAIEVVAEKFSKHTPVLVILVEMENKEKVFGQLVYSGKDQVVKIGKKVKSVLRKMSDTHPEDVIQYGLKFKILEE